MSTPYVHGQDITISKPKPAIRLDDKQTGGQLREIVNDAGVIKGLAEYLEDRKLKFVKIDNIFSTKVTQSIPASGNYVIPKGLYIYKCDTDVKLQYNDAGNWVDISGSGAMGLIISDGVKVRALNTHSSNAENITLFPLQ
jgi:hypothetical protein